jgi:hypothetical protein
MYFLAIWVNLPDRTLAKVLCESVSLRAFWGMDLGRAPAVDEMTECGLMPSAGFVRFGAQNCLSK